MSVPPVAPDISGYLSHTSEQEKELLRIFGPQQSMTIFDVGACEGEDSIRYTQRFPNARVFTFEPLPSNQELILANFAKYSARRAELVPIALSDRKGRAQFHVSSGTPAELFCGADWNYGNKSSSLLPPATDEPMYGWLRFEEKLSVECETLDGFCLARGIERIDFLHLDVQGAEALVLAGAQSMIKRIVSIWLEVSDQELYKGQKLRVEIERLLRLRGFALCMQARRDGEGDQFYVNLRYARVWPNWVRSRVLSLYGRIRSAAAVRGRRVLRGMKLR